MATCRACGAEITWVVVTSTRSKMPLDPTENEAGNVAVDRRGARVLHVGQRPLPDEALYVPHFATCPKWKGPK